MAPITQPLRVVTLSFLLIAANAVTVSESASAYTLANDRVSFNALKKNGYIQHLAIDRISVLGTPSGNAGQLYTDFPSKAFALTSNPSFEIIQGDDFPGLIITDNDAAGSLVQRSWFLRDGETGLHSFVRLAFQNATAAPKGALGEVRTMFRPNGGPWTTLVTNAEQWAPIPGAEAIANQVQVQDATWYLGRTPDDAYVQQESDYWTKYSFADNQTNKAHGLYGQSSDGTPIGAWWVVNQKDTFFGGPFHVDLMVDGIIYNKQSTSHGGATSPNITDGFDRTFGPQTYLSNHAPLGPSLQDLLADAEQYADPAWNAEFYDKIAPHVVGYAPTSSRGSFSANVHVPPGAEDVVAILSANGVHFQDSANDPSAYQYWQTDVRDGVVNIDRVKEGTYRLTVAASGIFGDYVQDDIVVQAGKQTYINATWVPESAGTELWRIGVPDKSAGEFKNGLERDFTHPRQPSKYRIYWGAWDFPSEFPGGVNFTIGKSVESRDWNYVHWSQYGPTYTRNDTVTDINRWTINFPIGGNTTPRLTEDSVATLTIQLAAAKSTAGNTDANQGAWPTFPISIYVNEQVAPLVWTIQANESSSCGERSAISCHLLSNKFRFPGRWLHAGNNHLDLALPHAAPVVSPSFG
ncbi:galactose mutarotase-like protein [Earliella scabrosa]|nr:galactose mutarotase-like protein [Earliella scabrosa]